MRRIYLDVVGRIPTLREARESPSTTSTVHFRVTNTHSSSLYNEVSFAVFFSWLPVICRDPGSAERERGTSLVRKVGPSSPRGRGGRDPRVTTLAATGPGSILEALNSPRATHLVFEVGGVIDLDMQKVDHQEPFLPSPDRPRDHRESPSSRMDLHPGRRRGESGTSMSGPVRRSREEEAGDVDGNHGRHARAMCSWTTVRFPGQRYGTLNIGPPFNAAYPTNACEHVQRSPTAGTSLPKGPSDSTRTPKGPRPRKACSWATIQAASSCLESFREQCGAQSAGLKAVSGPPWSTTTSAILAMSPCCIT